MIGHPWGGSQPPSSPLCGDVMTEMITDKESLFDEVSIERLVLCVKKKAISRCRTIFYASFERNLRDGI